MGIATDQSFRYIELTDAKIWISKNASLCWVLANQSHLTKIKQCVEWVLNHQPDSLWLNGCLHLLLSMISGFCRLVKINSMILKDIAFISSKCCSDSCKHYGVISMAKIQTDGQTARHVAFNFIL